MSRPILLPSSLLEVILGQTAAIVGDVPSSQVPDDIELPKEPATVVFDGFSHQHILRDRKRKFNDGNGY
ncbi:MAG: hypothetical protein ACYS8I_15870 [Planctomycetota bacterium]|jgi:hypothetical protein